MNKCVNTELLEEQKYWVKSILKTYWTDIVLEGNIKVCADKSKILSHPFYMGLSDEYINCADGRKRLMIIGQEAMGYGSICDGTAKYDFIMSCTPKKCEEHINEPNNSQEWAKAYVIKQLYDKNIELPECYHNAIQRNNSPFWRLFRALNESGKFVLCWNNLDKVYFTDSGELNRNTEQVLSSPYAKKGEEAKSILQREIEIAHPDVVLFVTGPTYAASMETAFGIGNKLKGLLTKDNGICDISNIVNVGKTVFWTYHPANRIGVDSAKLFLDKYNI